MNALIYDASSGIARFAASILRAQGHRVAVTADPDEARLKIATSLFDAVILGPSGAPRALAEFIEGEFPHLPLVLAGVPAEVPPAGQVAAVLAAPLSAERLVSAFRLLERRRRERLARPPVALADEGAAVSCRLADLTSETLVLAGESDEFHRYFGGGPRRVRVSILGVPVEGEVARAERSEFHRVRRVDVRLEEPSARDLLACLRRGVPADEPAGAEAPA